MSEGIDFSNPKWGEGVKTNSEPRGIDFNNPNWGKGVTTNSPSRRAVLQDHIKPKPENYGLSDLQMQSTVKAKSGAKTQAKSAPKETISEAPKFLGSYALHDIKRKVKGVLWGDRTSPKSWDEKSGFEKRGVLGQAVATGTGIPLVPEDQQKMAEDLVAGGGGMAGGIYGFKQGMKTGDPRKALVAGMLGSSLGYSAAKVAQEGELPTVGEQTRELIYGVVPSQVKMGTGAVREAGKMAARMATINETAMQMQATLDQGELLDIDPASVVKRNLLAAGMGGTLGALAGRKMDRKAVEQSIELSPALSALKGRVRYWEGRINTAEFSPEGSPSTKALTARKAKFEGKLKEAKEDLNQFLDDPSFLIKNPSSARAVRVSQVVRQGGGEGAGYDANEALAKTYLRFDALEEPPLTYKEQATKAMDSVSENWSSRFHPLKTVERDVRSEYGKGTPKHDLGAKFETLPGSYSKAQADLDTFDLAVTDRLHSLAKTNSLGVKDKPSLQEVRRDFDVYMFLRRTKQRLQSNQKLAAETKLVEGDIESIRKNLKGLKDKEILPQEKAYLKELEARLVALKSRNSKAVADYTLGGVDEELLALRSRLGESKFAEFDGIADEFQVQADKALKLQVESGRMSQEMYDAIKAENDFYAPFSVKGYSDATESAFKGGSTIDTQASFTQQIKGIRDQDFMMNGILESMRGMVFRSRVLSEKNLRMQDLKRVADIDKDGLFIKPIKDGQRTREGHSIISILVDGKSKHYEVSDSVAAPIKNFGDVANDWISIGARATSLPFKAGATALNIPFQAKNLLLADMPRAAFVSNYGIQNPRDVAQFSGDYLQSLYASITGQFDRGNKLYRDAMEAGVLRSNLQQMITPEALGDYRKLGQGEGVLNNVSKFSNAIEESFKILGVKRAIKMHGAQNVQELLAKNPEAVTEIRRYSGSPDFARFGKSMERANLYFMFLNARTQGIVSDASRLGNLKSKAGRAALTKMGIAVGGPTAALYAYNRINHYEDLKNVPDRDKANHHIIFKDNFVTNEHGEKTRDYYKVPKREAGKIVANFVESGLDLLFEKDPEAARNWALSTVENLSPINIEGEDASERTESMLSSIHPVLRVPFEVVVPQGRNLWQHRDMMGAIMAKAAPQEQYTDRTPKSSIALAHWIHEKTGGKAPDVLRSPIKVDAIISGTTAGLLSQFMPDEPMQGRSEIENHWVVRSLGQSFMSGGYKFDTKKAKLIKELKQQAATETVIGMRVSRKFVEERSGKKAALIMKEAEAEFPVRGKDGTVNLSNRKMIERVADRVVENLRGIKIEDQVLRSLPSKQRAAFIMNQLEGQSDSMKVDYIREYVRKGVLTEDTAIHMGDELKRIYGRD